MNRYLKICLIFILALSLRVGYAAFSGFNKPNFQFNYDAAEYHNIAMHLKKGYGYRLDGELTAKRPPIYPMLLAAIYSLFGEKFWLVKIFQAILSSATCCIVFFSGLGNIQ